jgi:hypothetical protein
MTDKQLYALCGTISMVGSFIANSHILGLMAVVWFVWARLEKEDPRLK